MGGDVQSVQPIRGMNSPSESKNPLKRIDENIQRISNRFQPISAISPEIDFRVGGDAQAIQPVRGINSPSESRNPPKRIDENIEAISHRFQPISAISPEIDFRVGGDAQAIESVRGINSPSESKNPLKRIDEDIQGMHRRFNQSGE